MTARTLMPRRLALALGSAALLAGCASVAPEQAIAPVQAAVQRHAGQALMAWPDASAPSDAARARIDQLLAAPLSIDGAAELALLNHRGLQAALAELGIAQAEAVQAARWPNPGFTLSRTRSGTQVEWERGLHFGLGRLLLMPLARALEDERLARAQTRTALQVLEQVSATRRAWVEAVAAQEALRYRRQVAEAAQAGAELAARMRAAGNFNRLAQAREQAFEADAALQLARAERHATATRERLLRALGLWGDQAGDGPGGLRLPERLPDLPATPAAPFDRPDLEAVALAQRLDVQLAREDTERAERLLGLTRGSRFVTALEVGGTRSSNSEGERSRGWEVGLELPIFDPGDARIARAEQTLAAARHRRAEVAINARSELREAWSQYRHAGDIARHLQTEVLPVAQRVSAENLLRYNGMLIGVFELLADARAQIGAVQAALDARREFWLADADLQMALLGRPALAAPGAAGAPTSSPSAAAPTGGGH